MLEQRGFDIPRIKMFFVLLSRSFWVVGFYCHDKVSRECGNPGDGSRAVVSYHSIKSIEKKETRYSIARPGRMMLIQSAY
jgi:hypothetical protein